MDGNEIPHDPHQDYHCLQTNRNQLPLEHRHLGVPSSAYKMISEPMVRSVQTVDLACFKITTIFKWTEMSFDLSIVT
jgi:hypothetical protein